MAKIELKGMILTVNQPQLVGEKQTKKQTLILRIPAYRDEYGDVKGKDEEWEIAIMGDNVDKVKLTKDHQEKKAKCTVYLNSNTYVKTSDNTTGYIINATLANIAFADDKPAPSPAQNNTGATSSNW